MSDRRLLEGVALGLASDLVSLLCGSRDIVQGTEGRSVVSVCCLGAVISVRISETVWHEERY